MISPPPGTTLPPLQLRDKPDYRGFIARFVGFVVWVLSKLPFDATRQWAKAFNEQYHTTLGDTLYSPPGAAITPRLLLHERVHRWQELELGRVRYFFRYLLRPKAGRLQIEAQAYASEVVAGHTPVEGAIKMLIGRTYYPEPWYTPSYADGEQALSNAIASWVRVGHDDKSMRDLIA